MVSARTRLRCSTLIAATVIACNAPSSGEGDARGRGGSGGEQTDASRVDGAAGQGEESGSAGATGSGGFAGSGSGGTGASGGCPNGNSCPPDVGLLCQPGLHFVPGPDPCGCPTLEACPTTSVDGGPPVPLCPPFACGPGQEPQLEGCECCPKVCVPKAATEAGQACVGTAPPTCYPDREPPCAPDWATAHAWFSSCNAVGAFLARCGPYNAVVSMSGGAEYRYFYDATGKLVGSDVYEPGWFDVCQLYDSFFMPPGDAVCTALSAPCDAGAEGGDAG